MFFSAASPAESSSALRLQPEGDWDFQRYRQRALPWNAPPSVFQFMTAGPNDDAAVCLTGQSAIRFSSAFYRDYGIRLRKQNSAVRPKVHKTGRSQVGSAGFFGCIYIEEESILVCTLEGCGEVQARRTGGYRQQQAELPESFFRQSRSQSP